MRDARIYCTGEGRLAVDWEGPAERVCSRAWLLAEKLREQQVPGIGDIAATGGSVMVTFDCRQLESRDVTMYIRSALAGAAANRPRGARLLRVPVCYGGVFGPDLEYVARFADLTVTEVIRLHTAVLYDTVMTGPLPGVPGLSGVPPQIAVPRQKKLRDGIPAGSVGIGGSETGFYPAAGEGDWRLIGRTPLKGFPPQSAAPLPLVMGDRVQFAAVTVDEYFAIRREVEAGMYQPDSQEME